MASIIRSTDFFDLSFAGIMWSSSSGLESVFAIPTIFTPVFLASWTGNSLSFKDETKMALGILVRVLSPPNFVCILASSLANTVLSFLGLFHLFKLLYPVAYNSKVG